jgi:hypothetical protein
MGYLWTLEFLLLLNSGSLDADVHECTNQTDAKEGTAAT